MCPKIFPQVKEFVITQHPTAETRDAFWTMLWDHNAQTVVLLTPLTQTTAVFWPVKHEEYDLDYFKVCQTLLMAKMFLKMSLRCDSLSRQCMRVTPPLTLLSAPDMTTTS